MIPDHLCPRRMTIPCLAVSLCLTAAIVCLAPELAFTQPLTPHLTPPLRSVRYQGTAREERLINACAQGNMEACEAIFDALTDEGEDEDRQERGEERQERRGRPDMQERRGRPDMQERRGRPDMQERRPSGGSCDSCMQYSRQEANCTR